MCKKYHCTEEISFPPLLGPQQMAGYCLRKCMLAAVAWLVPDPNVDRFFLPRLTPRNVGVGCQLHLETQNLMQCHQNIWPPCWSYALRSCCCWIFMLPSKLHHCPFLSLNLRKCFMYFLQSFSILTVLSCKLQFTDLQLHQFNFLNWSIKHIRSWKWISLKTKTQPACWNMLGKVSNSVVSF